MRPARTLSAHALSVFGDHSDVMACRNTGFGFIASSSPQEVMDMGAVAHLTAIHCRMAMLHFFDGFRTSHEIQKIDAFDYEDLRPLVDMDALRAFRKNSLNPEHPATRGTTVNPDIFFQTREALNTKFDAIPEAVEHYMQEINKITGRDYHLYRPFSAEAFLKAMPATAKKIAVLGRTKEPGGLTQSHLRFGMNEIHSPYLVQASKSTVAAAIAKFAAGGKMTRKKDLGMMAMSCGYVYVAQIALGANPGQALRAIREAEAYDGPSLIICYCPCIKHHMKNPMGLSITEEKKAVEAGYWHLYRYDPQLADQGKSEK